MRRKLKYGSMAWAIKLALKGFSSTRLVSSLRTVATFEMVLLQIRFYLKEIIAECQFYKLNRKYKTENKKKSENSRKH